MLSKDFERQRKNEPPFYVIEESQFAKKGVGVLIEFVFTRCQFFLLLIFIFSSISSPNFPARFLTMRILRQIINNHNNRRTKSGKLWWKRIPICIVLIRKLHSVFFSTCHVHGVTVTIQQKFITGVGNRCAQYISVPYEI